MMFIQYFVVKDFISCIFVKLRTWEKKDESTTTIIYVSAIKSQLRSLCKLFSGTQRMKIVNSFCSFIRISIEDVKY